MATNHRINQRSLPSGTPELHRPGEPESARYLARNSGRVAPTLSRGSKEPTPSQVQVQNLPEGTPMSSTAVPPKRKSVSIESSGGPSYLHHGKQ